MTRSCRSPFRISTSRQCCLQFSTCSASRIAAAKGSFSRHLVAIPERQRERRRVGHDRASGQQTGRDESFEGFDGETAQAILGDLLLCFCLENAKRALGRKEQVQRVAPAHYMASWVDLPDRWLNLRYVPEMIVAMLADQKGDYVQQNREGDQDLVRGRPRL